MPRSRGSFNTSFDLYTQAGGIPALVPYATDVPCRFVVQDQIFPQLFPFSVRIAWVTFNAAAPTLPTATWVGPAVNLTYSDCDLLVVASRGPTFWVPILPEIVTPEGEPTYIRFWVAEKWY